MMENKFFLFLRMEIIQGIWNLFIEVSGFIFEGVILQPNPWLMQTAICLSGIL